MNKHFIPSYETSSCLEWICLLQEGTKITGAVKFLFSCGHFCSLVSTVLEVVENTSVTPISATLPTASLPKYLQI